MKARTAGLIAAVIIGAATLLPAPRIAIRSPRLLYTLAIYKAATGDTGSALRLLQQAEKDAQRATHSECEAPL